MNSDAVEGTARPIATVAMTRRGVVVDVTLYGESLERREKAAASKMCAWCGKPFTWPRKVYCSDECGWEFSKQYYGRTWAWIRQQAIDRDQHTCKNCGEKCDFKRRLEIYNDKSGSCSCEVDHIIEVSKGGDDRLTNLQTLCSKCHRLKTDQLLKDILPRQQERLAQPPQRSDS